MNVAMILAGGVGSRVGAPVPKQFIEVAGKPILIHTLDVFQRDALVDAIEIVCIQSHMDVIWDMVERFGITKVRWVCQGGDTFQQSVLNGMDHLENVARLDDDDIVLIHFGVSPFVTEAIIDDSIRVCEAHGNGIASDPCVLCMCRKQPENPACSTEGLDRETLMGLNSPQTFRMKYLRDLYDEGFAHDIWDELDDPHTTTLMLALGRELYFSRSTQANIKITTPEDVELFEGYVLARQLKEERTKSAQTKE